MYELQRPGLGQEFDAAVQAAFDLLEGEVVPMVAKSGVAGKQGAMRLILKRFPFDIVVTFVAKLLSWPWLTIPDAPATGAIGNPHESPNRRGSAGQDGGRRR